MKCLVRLADEVRKVNLTPLKAIRFKCLGYSSGSHKEVRWCKFNESEPNCFLYPYRFGKRAKSPLTPIKTIRKYCLWCCGESYKEAKLCPSATCALYPYRLGKNPARAGQGGQGNIIENLKKRELSSSVMVN